MLHAAVHMNRGHPRGRVARPARRARASLPYYNIPDRAPARADRFARRRRVRDPRGVSDRANANVIRMDERRKHTQTLGPRRTRAPGF